METQEQPKEPKPKDPQPESQWLKAAKRVKVVLSHPVVRRVLIAVLTYWISRTEFGPLWAEVKGYLEQ